MEETQLIQYARSGDLDAFNRLVIQYQDSVYGLALRILGDPAAAADAAQDAFLSAYKGVKRFRGGSFRAWLMRIVTNACYDELRRRQRKPETGFDDLLVDEDANPEDAAWMISPDEGPEQSAQRTELGRALRTCLDSLPDEFRVVAVLVDVQGYDYKEAAFVAEIPVGTVKSRLARARAALRLCLQSNWEHLPARFRLEDEAAS